MKKLILLIASFNFVGCVSMSSLQTARTTPKDTSQQSFGGGVYNSKMNVGTVKSETSLPYFEYSHRYGFTDDLDAGFKLTFIGAYSADAKYQIYTNNKLALAAGAGFGYMSYKVSAGTDDQDVKFLDIMLPLYLSYDFTPGFTLYTSPKYIMRKISGSTSESDGITGLTVGTKIGEKSGVFVEATVIKGKGDTAVTQYNISYFW